MPKATFLNLSEEKKDRILQVSIEEFSVHSFEKASINRIVTNAEIAKGSFYQYFQNKTDLYKYILGVANENKLKYLKHIIDNIETLNFFEALRALFLEEFRFAKKEPKLWIITNEPHKILDANLKKEILGENMLKDNEIIKNLILQGINNGELDSEVDVEFTAFTIASLGVSIGEYFNKELEEVDDRDYVALLDKMLIILEKGIKKKRNILKNKNIEDRFY